MLRNCVVLREPPRHRAGAITGTTSRRWRGIATPSRRCSYGSTSRRCIWRPKFDFHSGHDLQQPIQQRLDGRRGRRPVRRTAPDTHEGLCEGRRETVHLEEALVGRVPVWKSNSVSGAPDNSSLSHFSAMTWPRWLRRAVRSRHRHAIEQMSRRWRGGQRGDSGRTRRRFDFHTTGYQTAPKKS